MLSGPKLRPVLDQRMPTLITKSTRASALESSFGPDFSELNTPTTYPPRHMKDVRAAMTKEIRSMSKLLHRTEREYYADSGNINNEVERYVSSIKVLMKTLMMFDMNNMTAVDELIRTASNPSLYAGAATSCVADVMDIYTKIQNFLPDRMSEIVDRCQSLLDKSCRFCVSFYSPEIDFYLETADNYSEQIMSWTERAHDSLQSVKSLYQRFRSSGLTIKMLSGPVATFCSNNSLQRVLFVVMFADAMTHLKNVIEILKAWVKADENYSTFLKNDISELETVKEEKVHELRDFRQRSHSLTYKLTQYETQSAKLEDDAIVLRKNEGQLRTEETRLVNHNTDRDREIEVKERERDHLRRHAPKTLVTGSSSSSEPLTERIETLSRDIKALKETLPLLIRQIAAVRLKLTYVEDKIYTLDKLTCDIISTQKHLNQMEQERDNKERQYSELEFAVEVARRILGCKTASDSVEKLYYSVPVGARAAKVAKTRDDVNIADPVEKACNIISKRINRDWSSLYRNLPFYPLRGSETIGRDIVELSETGARGSYVIVARQSLRRWRRYHTRTNVYDLKQALRRIKRLDILKVLDVVLNPPTNVSLAPFEVQEEALPPVDAHLIPFYKQIERYDQFRANRLAAETEAAKKKAMKHKT